MKTAVVTGATSGIGLATAIRLAGMGVRVIGVGRNDERCATAMRTMEAICDVGQTAYVAGDLSTTAAVRRVAQDIRILLGGNAGPLDILIHAAGTVSSWHVSTGEAYELQFAVNHLAPFLLTHELMPNLRQAVSARVLTVSSNSHYHTRIHWDDVMMRRHYRCLAAYRQSKLCNVLFSAELARRLQDTSIWTYAIDPGLVDTDIGSKGTSGIEHLVWRFRRRSGDAPEVPAGFMADIATSPDYAGQSGGYWRNGRWKRASAYARERNPASRLWILSERLCGID